MKDQGEPSKPQWLQSLCAEIEQAPDDYRSRYEKLKAIRHGMLRTFADALAGPLNDYVQTLPQNDLAEKGRSRS